MKTTRKHSEIGGRDFDGATKRALLKKGIVIVSITAIPDMSHPMPYANATRGYILDDNGTQRIRTLFQVKVLAGTATTRETELAAM